MKEDIREVKKRLRKTYFQSNLKFFFDNCINNVIVDDIKDEIKE